MSEEAMVPELIEAADYEQQMDEVDNVPDDYAEYRDNEGVPVHARLFVEDVRTVETGYWERTEQNGAIINLFGSEGLTDIHVHDIEPNGETTTQQHLFDELVYVADGNGMTVLGEGDKEIMFEWDEHSLFSLPPNTPYRHVNLSDNTSARLVSDTPLPQYFNMFTNQEFIMNPPGSAWDIYYDEELYSADPNIITEGIDLPGAIMWESNFIPDIKHFDNLEPVPERGAGGNLVLFPFPDVSLWSHISEFPIGRYKKCHRHSPGSDVMILSGEGFSIFQPQDDDEYIILNWKPGSLVTPPGRWFHQHFNTSTESARYFALHMPEAGTLFRRNPIFDVTHSDNQIEYTDEPEWVREYFNQRLSEVGIDSNMPDECYTNPDFKF